MTGLIYIKQSYDKVMTKLWQSHYIVITKFVIRKFLQRYNKSQKLCQSYYVSHNETLKPDKRFCYDFVIRMFFHLASFFGSSTADYLVPRPSIPHRGTASVYLLLMPTINLLGLEIPILIFSQLNQRKFFPPI